MNCYSMTTMRIWARSKKPEKWKIYEWVTQHNANANDDIHACVTLHYTDVNDTHLSLRGTARCVHLQPHPLSVVRTFSGSVVVSSSSRTHAPWLKFESFHLHPWSSSCVQSVHLDSPFLLLALPSPLFPLLQLLEVCGKPAQLLQGGCRLH